ncbi:hypothetical protein BABINDRAFT_161698 [Babjeviella inositovora NRRL Y-12698]|uniref:Uncharacterized protein n=1 Tax=Babjeviella inositovora NRRL Y-12698 TaxID=984486 RepID=A0A1E3QQV7_9ASCO|nr:uncharacterized protein BABINDRAFT_161698 [Babjeviella inositovora NRRL Y-12698]ODQ80061.1 hypothetical protein BABINDRAFT_161698 [Babjeviella inositovora NRRL Y-12698]
MKKKLTKHLRHGKYSLEARSNIVKYYAIIVSLAINEVQRTSGTASHQWVILSG